MDVMTCLFYSESIDGDSSGQEQGGQMGRLYDGKTTQTSDMKNPVLIGGHQRNLGARYGVDCPAEREMAERDGRRAKLCVWTITQAVGAE